MLEGGNRRRVNTPKVIHETLDGQKEIVNGVSGAYYSLEWSAGAAWPAFAAGASQVESVDPLASGFSSQRAMVAAEFGRFLVGLINEGLPVPTTLTMAPALSESEPGRSAFVAPVLGKYTDMQELLLRGSVHEVDAVAGWLHPKPQA